MGRHFWGKNAIPIACPRTPMKYLPLLLCLSFPLSAFANPALEGIPNVGERHAPAELNRDTYLQWAEPILNATGNDLTSPFTDIVFAWYEEQKNSPLPEQVAKDPQKIFVDTLSAKRQTIDLEEKGFIPPYVTAGANVYAEIPGTTDQALDATLYLWGKPAKQAEGKTKPVATPSHSARVNYLAANPLWGAGAYGSLEIRSNGGSGLVSDLSDRYLMLVRGDSVKGYDIFMQYIGPGSTTETTKVFAIATIRPLPNGKVAHKIASRYMGQSYGALKSMGRELFAFNAAKVRQIELTYVKYVNELRTTGNIADEKNDL